MRRLELGLIVTVLLLGCSGHAPSPGATPSADERALAVSIEARITCREPIACERRLREEVASSGGFLAMRSGPAEGPIDLAVRVPSAHRSELTAALFELDAEAWTDERAADLTDARVDGAARLRNARASEGRILALTEAHTATLAEVLAAEHELERIRERIELLEASQRESDRRVEMVELQVRITGHQPSWSEQPVEAIATAFSGGAEAAYRFGVGVVVVTAALLPTGAVTVALLWLARSLLRRWRLDAQA